MKKILFGLGTVAAVVAPVVSVVACGDKAETKINGKTAKEIKAMTPDQFEAFLNETLHKDQPDTLDKSQSKFKFIVKSKTELRHIDTLGHEYQLNVSDVNAKDFLAHLAIYTTTKAGSGNGGSTEQEIKDGTVIKSYWKNIVDAAKIYFAK